MLSLFGIAAIICFLSYIHKQAVGGKGAAGRRADARMASAFASEQQKLLQVIEDQRQQLKSNEELQEKKARQLQEKMDEEMQLHLQQHEQQCKAAQDELQHVQQQLISAQADLASMLTELNASFQRAESFKQKETAAWRKYEKHVKWHQGEITLSLIHI